MWGELENLEAWAKSPRCTFRGMAENSDSVSGRFGAVALPIVAGTRVGIALQTMGQLPLNGLRVPPEGNTCGWYLWWGGEMDTADDFFQALCVEHLDEYCPELLPYLELPPGWRVQLAPGYEDVWFDEPMLDQFFSESLQDPK